jgi:hypothetical protein
VLCRTKWTNLRGRDVELRQSQAALVVLTAFTFILLAGCGSRDGAIPAPTAPVFTSTPVTQAVEGAVYAYQLATNSGSAAFALSNAPVGATLNGNTISWMPTSAQSRTANSFTVTATTPGGPSATQSWTVTPNGTVRISRIDTVWNESRSTDSPFNWSPVSSFVAALVPQPDGSFASLPGAPGISGVFEIPNVPAGYYWLRISPREIYWTSNSNIDVGTDRFDLNLDHATTNSTTTFNFNFTSLDAAAGSGWLQVTSPESVALQFAGTTASGSTNFTAYGSIGGNIDFSGVRNAFVMQYKPTSIGYLKGALLGPELALTNLSLTTGSANTISGALNPSVPASINLSVEASAWTPLLDHIAPTAPTAIGGGFYAYVQPYTAVDNPNVPWTSSPINLIATLPDTASVFWVLQTSCSGETPSAVRSGGFSTATTLQPMTTDVSAGTVQYSDPFPAAWRRTFIVCQNAAVDVPVPGTSTTQSIVLTNSQTTSMPTGTVKPLIAPVQNPKLNGADILTASTIIGTSPTLSWNPPAIGTPFGYQVEIMAPTTALSGVPHYGLGPTLSTTKTSMTIPPGLLQSGQTYLFVISSLVDGRANMEASPHRSSLPVAQADLISAPVTISN